LLRFRLIQAIDCGDYGEGSKHRPFGRMRRSKNAGRPATAAD